ncbi:probable RNA-binding protein 46 [Zerene cesonia]|uniref:probable RNA-binding protein 46 n=1 Tax=Zerene cesonia TaxID=33412 RepID=UPI0018E5254F|nr:probable RNA-binding protein 46 [Zerene cesonia]
MPSVKNYPSSEVNQYELSSRLLTLTENNTSYTLTQINGQRIYRKAPHAWNGPEPSRNCEVFIGRIPHDCFEDTLVPLFRQAGELFEFRLMINFSGWNRGYAFAMYTTEVEASNAIRMFNNYMIRPSWQLGVCPSINNCRIFISRIPAGTPSAEIVRLVYALTEEAVEVRVRRSGGGCAAIVEYRSHRGAAMARKALVAAAAAAWGAGARPAVDWSLPQSPHLLRQYREVGRWTPERGVEIYRLPEEPASSAAASYSLERWSQARRLRMIHEAHRAHAHAQLQPQPQLHAHAPPHAAQHDAQHALPQQQHPQQPQQQQAQPLSLVQQGQLQNATTNDWGRSSMSASPLSSSGSTWGTWGPWGSSSEGEAADAPPYNPWTAPHPLHEFMDKQE